MRIKFQADADFDRRALRGLRRIAPEIDMRTAADAGLEGLDDPEVLLIAASSARILVSQDRSTMPAHFRRFVSGSESPRRDSGEGRRSDCEVIEELLLIWATSEPDDPYS
jgi:hypothetical protein